MNDIEIKLRKCFEAVFPKLKYEQIPHATMEGVGEWDSASTVMLVAVIEEEFGLEVGLEALESLLSFRSALEYVEKAQGTAGRPVSDHPAISISASNDPFETTREPKPTFDR